MPKGYDIDHNLMPEMTKKKASVASSIQFSMIFWNLKNELITKMNPIDHKVLND